MPTPKRTRRTPIRIENSTDATRGEPLGIRAHKRKAELEAALAKLPADSLLERSDLQLALASVEELMTGDLEHLSDVVAAGLNRWLEHTKHLAEGPAIGRRRARH